MRAFGWWRRRGAKRLTRAGGWALAIAGLGWLALPAHGTTGGPDLLEVLGWDPREGKVFVAQHYRGDSGYPPAIASLALEGHEPGRAVVVPWSVAGDAAPGDYARRARALQAQLQPLPAIPAASMFSETRILAVDTMAVGGVPWPRYRVRVSRLHHDWGGTLEVLTVRDPSVRVLSVHPIPGRAERLAIVAFLGIPWESGYETQVPVLLGGAGDTLRVEWQPFRR